MDEKELFENLCFLPDWSEIEPKNQSDCEKTESSQEKIYVHRRKDLSTLLAELEQIKNAIEDVKAREWNLAKLMKFHKEGFSFR